MSGRGAPVHIHGSSSSSSSSSSSAAAWGSLRPGAAAAAPAAASSALFDRDGFPQLHPQHRNTWVWPASNEGYADRQYQLEIAASSLFANTLVSLPTGLGKTFIAAVVMYNFYRWFPGGQVVFLAPTKPLVSQQVEACFKIVGFPPEHTANIQGAVPKKERLTLWRERRVFYCTPQAFQFDMANKRCSPRRITLVVFDEGACVAWCAVAD